MRLRDLVGLPSLRVAATGRVSDRAVVAASGFALRIDNSANRVNPLPDHEFAQLDAHNCRQQISIFSPKAMISTQASQSRCTALSNIYTPEITF
ncbi:MAG: hypothetical protein AB1513_11780 [Pseudomonadota bacterium]